MAVEGETYMLRRDAVESKRLDVQHDYMRHLAYGQLVHPCVDVGRLERVADVGTGTGIWLQELADESASRLEGTQYVGFDISPQQFKQEYCPDVTFVIHDAVKPFPEEYLERFDLVHVRLLSYALKDQDLKAAVENIVSLVRPGGYLQWEEVDARDCWATPETSKTRAAVSYVMSERVARGLTQVITIPLVKALQSLTQHLHDGKFSPLTWNEDLVRILHLETISTENHKSPLVNAMKQDQVLTGARILNQAGIARRQASLSDSSKSVAEISALEKEVKQMKDLIEAIDAGEDPARSVWEMEITRILARKVKVTDRDGAWMSARKYTA